MLKNYLTRLKTPLPFQLLLLLLSVIVISCNNQAESAGTAQRRTASEGPPIHVLLSQGQSRLELGSPEGGSWRIGGPKGPVQIEIGAGEFNLSATERGVEIDGREYDKTVMYFVPEGNLFSLEGRSYRGVLKVHRVTKTNLRAFELVQLEDYIRGVLPAEIYPHWPLHAIVAQAVSIRTFALHMVTNRASRPWLTRLDLAYLGADHENERTNRAVELSRGLIMTWDDKLFPAFFHSTCGGHTASARNVFNSHDIPPLSGDRCGYCDHSRHSLWDVSFSLTEIAERVFPDKDNFVINSIRTRGFDHGGRPEFVVINGTETVRSSEFRLAMGTAKLKSTMFIATITDDKAIFIGRGFGHGVGLCQWGANGMAQTGKNWEDILLHYYPGIEIKSTGYFMEEEAED